MVYVSCFKFNSICNKIVWQSDVHCNSVSYDQFFLSLCNRKLELSENLTIAPLQRISCSSKDIKQENLKILNRNKILTIKGHNSVTNKQIITGKNPNLGIVSINAYTKFVEILSICSPDIEQKRNSDTIKGHNSVTNLRKIATNNLNLNLVNINSYI